MEKIKLAYILTPVLSNKVAYLIAAGGTHNGVQINGIGENKMFDIFYYANTDELNATSNFAELRVACIRVATQKYGKQSTEVQAVMILRQ